ncbi:hypothetical protein I317_07342 [Kwoniella heveanensis CBS 569]|uniref:Uncharacterized protein n=1 Tax=Kwoniella heveanensis BCC8398 TaxID=1296120 RepID=A0A1B9GJB8_9TREE|nr:hypothetical protein I316_07229 [Kwoniella heveanensis BCC8398]OCF38862.1 hypothetical protein I317_07342 [Kwoniella heveanensis CBS 569]
MASIQRKLIITNYNPSASPRFLVSPETFCSRPDLSEYLASIATVHYEHSSEGIFVAIITVNEGVENWGSGVGGGKQYEEARETVREQGKLRSETDQ